MIFIDFGQFWFLGPWNDFVNDSYSYYWDSLRFFAVRPDANIDKSAVSLTHTQKAVDSSKIP